MKPEIRTIQPQNVLFVRKHGEYINAAPKPAWAELMTFVEEKNFAPSITKKIGVLHDDRWEQPKDQLRYDACIAVEKPVQAYGAVETQQLPGGTFAVFLHTGPFDDLDATYDYIFNTWLPNSRKTMRSAPIFEVYLNCELKHSDPTQLKTEIFIPIEE